MGVKQAKRDKVAGGKVSESVLESRGSCYVCKRFMTNQQELALLDGEIIHRACMPGPAEWEKRPNSYYYSNARSY